MNNPINPPGADPWQTPDELAAGPIVAVSEQPRQIGRYRIDKILGEGGFGRVYLAFDDQLSRPVAIKVPRRERLLKPKDAEAYLTEARTVAGLDHPNIVPVHDVGTTEDGLCFVVSKLIEGSDLAKRIQQGAITHAQAAAWIATAAEALHHAHGKGLVHRDIKPGNILLDTHGVIYVADFGLALKEADFGKGTGFAGTPAYMSPEQARGEGHRVDGRSDIFSLGVVLYELLVGRRPFKADTQQELLQQITTVEARPPRQMDDTIPKELERICLKALSKRTSERYTTARDLAEDLRHFLGTTADAGNAPLIQPRSSDAAVDTPVPIPTDAEGDGEGRSIKVVPKGLRSFDAHDADFFLELLPGPRDREGLPDSIRFWKTRIEETDADSTFLVGLIYGPSGCGKSSLMKAGLLPRLADHVLAVYVEATAEDTEARLLKGLHKQCPDLPATLSLVETLAQLRRGQYLPAGKKLILILDQFEQWLHARRGQRDTELVQALRHCDGSRVQGIVMVRDDFGMAATRFMAAVDIPIVQGQNFATVDLFDPLHARKVLAEFGRAFGRLPDNLGHCTRAQEAFLDRAVSGLAQEGKIISVRLALFAEMVKGKPWTPATLKEVGGMEGVGVAFLEETFAASTAPPPHRVHQMAAQAVLKSLLPEVGTNIKGNLRSQQELLAASGYAARPADFDALLRILDAELRLITPTETEEKDDGGRMQDEAKSDHSAAASSPTLPPASFRCYQLTHDYLVPSLRDWLTRKQKETRRGRAELRLADRSAIWNARPENRQLPSLPQWLNIRFLTRKRNWSPSQQKMMLQAGRYHAVRGAMFALVFLALALSGWGIRKGVIDDNMATKTAGLVNKLLAAKVDRVPGIIREIEEYRPWADPLLRQENALAAVGSPQKLHTSLALLPVDPGELEYLYQRLLDAQPQEVVVIQDTLAPYKGELVDKLWPLAERSVAGAESQRLRAASALAFYDSDNSRWDNISKPVMEQLVTENPVFLSLWTERFRFVRLKCLSSLAEIFRDRREAHAAERTLATNILADYAFDQPMLLAELLMDADEKQFTVLYPKFQVQAEAGLAVLLREIDKKLPSSSNDDDREKLAKRRANAAVALLRMNYPAKVWPLLEHTPDPRVRSLLIHRFGPLGAQAGPIIKRLADGSDLAIQRALILSLWAYGAKDIPAAELQSLTATLQDIYRTSPDPGLHAAAEWLLRSWNHQDWLSEVNNQWAWDMDQRQQRLKGIQDKLAKDKDKTPLQWYVNGEKHTMVVIPGPTRFSMGSPLSEVGRDDDEKLHTRRIVRTYAIAAKPVTVEQFRKFDKSHGFGHELQPKYTRTADLPMVGTSWYEAAAYCNWLSEQEGIDPAQWCYELSQRKVTRLKKYLSLTGYRLPTEAELEYATRANAATSRFFGETEELLPRYAWYQKNSSNQTWPVGSLKPNDFGLFDAGGNVFNWCQESYKAYPTGKSDQVFDDEEDSLVGSDVRRVLRGGSFVSQASLIRSAYRAVYVPTYQYERFGFRVARTLAP